MSLRNAYREKLEALVEEQMARISLLKAKAKSTAADGKIMAYEEIADAEQKLAHMKSSLKELASASEGAWEELKGGVEKAWNDLSESCKKAYARFGEKETAPAGSQPPEKT